MKHLRLSRFVFIWSLGDTNPLRIVLQNEIDQVYDAVFAVLLKLKRSPRVCNLFVLFISIKIWDFDYITWLCLWPNHTEYTRFDKFWLFSLINTWKGDHLGTMDSFGCQQAEPPTTHSSACQNVTLKMARCYLVSYLKPRLIFCHGLRE